MKKQVLLMMVISIISGAIAGFLANKIEISHASEKGHSEIICAKSFRVIGKDGHVSAILEENDGKPGLTFIDRGPEARIYMGLYNNVPRIVMLGKDNDSIITIGIEEKNKPKLVMNENKNVTSNRIEIGYDYNKRPRLTVGPGIGLGYDYENWPRVNVGRFNEIVLSATKEKPSIKVAKHHNDGIELTYEANGKTPTLTVTASEESAYLSLFGSTSATGIVMADKNQQYRAGMVYGYREPNLGPYIVLNDGAKVPRWIAALNEERGAQMDMLSKDGKSVVRLAARDKEVFIEAGNAGKVSRFASSIGASSDKGPWLNIKHQNGSRVISGFSSWGQPYLGVETSKKRLWSAPDPPPAGVPLKPKK
jgi:hypothetical protein